jgi:hypothetical protein
MLAASLAPGAGAAEPDLPTLKNAITQNHDRAVTRLREWIRRPAIAAKTSASSPARTTPSGCCGRSDFSMPSASPRTEIRACWPRWTRAPRNTRRLLQVRREAVRCEGVLFAAARRGAGRPAQHRQGRRRPRRKTIPPHKASAQLDLRLVPGQTAAEARAQHKAQLAKRGSGDIAVAMTGSSDPTRTPAGAAIIQAQVAVLRRAGIEPVLCRGWPAPIQAMCSPMRPCRSPRDTAVWATVPRRPRPRRGLCYRVVHPASAGLRREPPWRTSTISLRWPSEPSDVWCGAAAPRTPPAPGAQDGAAWLSRSLAWPA